MKKIVLAVLVFTTINCFCQTDPPGLIYSCKIKNGNSSKYAVFNSSGQKIINDSVDWAHSNTWSWLFVVDRASKLKTAYNYSGKKLIDSIEETKSVALNSNRVPIKKKGKWGFYDKSGQPRIKHMYDDVSDFSENKAAVKSGEAIFMIDTNGAKLPVPYDPSNAYYSFEDVDIAVGMGGEFYYADYKKIVKDGKAGLLEVASNQLLIPIEYDDLVDIKDKFKLITGKKNGKCGLLNFSGQVVIPFDYEAVFVLNDYF